MAKRFIDTEIWAKKWFMELSPVYKLVYVYLFTNCDCVGVWTPNELLANFIIGEKSIDWDHFFNTMQRHIEILEDGKYFLIDFCDFQYGELKGTCKPHKKYIAELKKHNLFERVCKGYTKGIHTLQEKEKEQEQEKEEEKEEEKKKPDLIITKTLETIKLPKKIKKLFVDWVDVRVMCHGKLPAQSQDGQLKRLLEIPEDLREKSLKAAITGTWKNIGKLDVSKEVDLDDETAAFRPLPKRKK